MRPITKTISLHKELIFRQQDTACLENWLHLRIRLSKIEWCAARWSRFPLFGLTDIDAAVESLDSLLMLMHNTSANNSLTQSNHLVSETLNIYSYYALRNNSVHRNKCVT